MGCITSTRQITIYYKDDLPECINLSFNFDKSLLPDFSPSQLVSFDDNDLLKSAKSFHIERVIIYYHKFIIGLAVTYKLDGKRKRVEHVGAGKDEALFEKMVLEEFEHIEYVQCTYS